MSDSDFAQWIKHNPPQAWAQFDHARKQWEASRKARQ